MDLKNTTLNRATRFIAPIICCLFLSACTVFHHPQPMVTASKTPIPTHFTAEGKLALRYPRCNSHQSCKTEAISAKFHWQHQPQQDELTFYGPLGQERLYLRYQGQHVTLRDDKGERIISRDQLTEELGIALPIDALNKWLFTLAQEDYQEQGWQISPKKWGNGYYHILTVKQSSFYLRLLLNKVVDKNPEKVEE